MPVRFLGGDPYADRERSRYVPSTYTRTVTAGTTEDEDQYGSHLAGIDTSLGTMMPDAYTSAAGDSGTPTQATGADTLTITAVTPFATTGDGADDIEIGFAAGDGVFGTAAATSGSVNASGDGTLTIQGLGTNDTSVFGGVLRVNGDALTALDTDSGTTSAPSGADTATIAGSGAVGTAASGDTVTVTGNAYVNIEGDDATTRTATGAATLIIEGGSYINTGSSTDDTITIDFALSTPGATATWSAVSSSTTLTESEPAVVVDATGGAIILTLPQISGLSQAGFLFWIHVDGADTTNTVTIQGTGGDTVAGAATFTISGSEDIQLKADDTPATDNWVRFQEARRGYTGIVTKTDTDYTVTDGDEFILCTTTSTTNYTITLPAIDAGEDERKITIVTDSIGSTGKYDVDTTGADTIGGTSGYAFVSERDFIQIIADNGAKNWAPRAYNGHPVGQENILAGTASVDYDTDQSVLTDTVGEHTGSAGVTVDGVLLKDGEVTTDVVNEATAATGVAVDGCTIKDGIAQDEAIFQAVKITNQTLTGSWAALTGWSASTFADSPFSWDNTNGELTVSADTEVELAFTIKFEQTAGTNRSTPEVRAMTDTGAGFNTLVPGTWLTTYTRDTTNPHGTVSTSVFYTFTSGDKVRLEVQYLALGGGATLIADRDCILMRARRCCRA